MVFLMRLSRLWVHRVVVCFQSPLNAKAVASFGSMFLVCYGLIFDDILVEFAGKSTLLNHLFGTNFREMDAFRGRHVLLFVNIVGRIL